MVSHGGYRSNNFGMWEKGYPPDLGSGHQVSSILTIPTKVFTSFREDVGLVHSSVWSGVFAGSNPASLTSESVYSAPAKLERF